MLVFSFFIFLFTGLLIIKMKSFKKDTLMILSAVFLTLILISSFIMGYSSNKTQTHREDTLNTFIGAMHYHNLKMDYKSNKEYGVLAKYLVLQGMDYKLPDKDFINNNISEPKAIELYNKCSNKEISIQEYLSGMNDLYNIRSEYMLKRYNQEVDNYYAKSKQK